MAEKKAYCKAHKCFDDCSSKVSKKMDDGIHHLLEVSRVNRSLENRGEGTLVPLLTGKRKLDGTPMMGHGEQGSAKITASDKKGSAPKVPLGKNANGHDAFAGETEISKKGEMSKGSELNKPRPKGFTAGRSLTTNLAPGLHGIVAGKKGSKFQASASETGGAIVGGGAGTLAGAALGSIVGKPAFGAEVGGGVGSVLGSESAGRRTQRRGEYKTVRRLRNKS